MCKRQTEIEALSSSSLSHQEARFAGFEGRKVCHITYDVLLVDQIQAIAGGSALLEAVGPLNSAAPQCCKLAIKHG